MLVGFSTSTAHVTKIFNIYDIRAGDRNLNLKTIIVGGGVGGLTAAICLRLTGWDVHVYEKATKISETGAGIQISPNGIKILDEIGVLPLLEETLFEPDAIEIRNGLSGRQLINLPMGGYAQARWNARYVQIHRADLVNGLRSRLMHLAPSSITTNAEVISVMHSPLGGVVTFTSHPEQQANLVIGADGIRSVVRQKILGQDRPQFTGNMAWRTTIDIDKLGDLVPPPTGCIWTGKKKHAVTTRIRAGQMVNFVGIVEQPTWQEEGWLIKGCKEDALLDFKGWDPRITNLIENAVELNRWGLFERNPLAKWHVGHIALLGDAAHAMLPSMAQGAVQSIEDACVLASVLKSCPKNKISDQLGKYFRKRIARTSKVQRISKRNLRLFHKATALSQLTWYGPIWIAGKTIPTIVQGRLDWLYDAEFPLL